MKVSPPSNKRAPASNIEIPGTRLRGVSLVENVDRGRLSVVFGRFSGGFQAAGPFDVVTWSVSNEFRLEHLLYFVFLVVVDFDGWGGGGMLCPGTGVFGAGSRRETWKTGCSLTVAGSVSS